MSEETEAKKCCITVTQEIVVIEGVYYTKCPTCGRETKEIREKITSDHLPFPRIPR